MENTLDDCCAFIFGLVNMETTQEKDKEQALRNLSKLGVGELREIILGDGDSTIRQFALDEFGSQAVSLGFNCGYDAAKQFWDIK